MSRPLWRRLLALLVSLPLVLLVASPATAIPPSAPDDGGGGQSFTQGAYLWWFSNTDLNNGIGVCYEGGWAYNNRAAIRDGLELWQRSFDFTIESFGYCGGEAGVDIEFHEGDISPSGEGVLGVTSILDGTYGQVVNRVKITFDSDELALQGTYLGQSLPVPNNLLDLVSISVHESGHALGLDHDDWGSGSQVMEGSGAVNCGYGNRIYRTGKTENGGEFGVISGLKYLYPLQWKNDGEDTTSRQCIT